MRATLVTVYVSQSGSSVREHHGQVLGPDHKAAPRPHLTHPPPLW